MVAARYVAIFGAAALLWAGLTLSFNWFTDPYGVSPINLSIDRLNRLKPSRINIDRLIKPYEVWRYQPSSIFLGTSRIHQAIDPRVLNGTRYAPGYNASIPANTLDENAAHIEQYLNLDPHLKFVFIELFLYNFILGGREETPKTELAAFESVAALQFSTAALFDSLATLQFNRVGREIGPYIAPEGYWVRPVRFNTNDTFNAQLFADAVVDIQKRLKTMLLQPSAFSALDRITQICSRHDADTYLFLTPSYPWDDYRLLSLGYWPLLEGWLRRVAQYRNVLNFAQYNSLTGEPVSGNMRYWNDPIHFSLPMGQLMLREFLGDIDAEMVDNLAVRLTPQNVETVIRERRAGLKQWAMKHSDFVELFEATKRAAGLPDFREIEQGTAR